ncbi:MAG: serpin family protein [Lachnospiraceae bacterium]|nr:serpin family protein [Lachnospiraceae bacterium]
MKAETKISIDKILSGIVLILMLMLFFAGCGRKTQEESNAAVIDLMADITSNGTGAENIDLSLMEESSIAVTDFSVKLFQDSLSERENTLISPITVLYALAMTANGAEGESLAQMEEVIGLSREEMNDYLYAYRNQMQEQMEENNKCTLEFANSIWLKEDENLWVEQDFLQTNADYYDADIYQLPFDASAVKSVNDWVSESTDGTIDEILTQMPENAVMYLISATILDAEWSEPYDSHQVREGVFTKEDGTTCQAEFMYETEYNKYLKDDNAQGFYKYYAGYGYAFAVLLPDEGISVSDYAASLTGDKLHNILSDDDKTLVQVNTAIPKFETAYETEMSDILKEMGMEDVFDGSKADLSGIGSYAEASLAINRLLHKTYIAVNEQGTKAGAAAVEEACAEAEEPEEMEIKTVYLDRPFIYMIIDRKSKVPVFMGTVMEVQSKS